MTTKPVSHDVEREKFEKLYADNFLNHVSEFMHGSYFELVDGEYVSLHCHGAYAGYKLAAAQQAEAIAVMQSRIDEMQKSLISIAGMTYDSWTNGKIAGELAEETLAKVKSMQDKDVK